MAIDTAKKRFAIMDFDIPSAPGMSPPDNQVNMFDQYSLLWLYYFEDDGPTPEPSEDTTRRIKYGMGLHHKNRLDARPLFHLKFY